MMEGKGGCILYPGRTHCIHCGKCAEFRQSVRTYARGLVEIMNRTAVRQSLGDLDAGQEYVQRTYHSSPED